MLQWEEPEAISFIASHYTIIIVAYLPLVYGHSLLATFVDHDQLTNSARVYGVAGMARARAPGPRRAGGGLSRQKTPKNVRTGVAPPPPPLPLADAHPSTLKSALESANPRMDSEGASGCPWSTARATAPSPGRPTPGVVKQDKSSGGSVDTTKTRLGPQRVRMSRGERPIGAAKGKQSGTQALCQPPPPPPPPPVGMCVGARRCRLWARSGPPGAAFDSGSCRVGPWTRAKVHRWRASVCQWHRDGGEARVRRG